MNTKILTKTANIIESLFVGVAIVLVFTMLISFFLPEFDYGITIIKSGSMEPTLKTGGIAILKTKDTYNMGDIITFTRGNTLVTHRIVKITGEKENARYRVKGDANEEPDIFTVKKNGVIGKVLFGIPFLGYAGMFIRTTTGIMLFIFIPTAWIIVRESMKIRKALKERKDMHENTV